MKAKLVLSFAILCSAFFFLSCSKETQANYWPTSEWKSISPKKVGMDEKLLDELALIQNSLPKIASVLAVRHGYVVFERYYTGSEKTLAEGYAITHSILSCLVGMAIRQRKIDGIDQKMVDFFPDNKLLSSDRIAQTITLRHLLTMSDGIRDSGNIIENYFSDPKNSRRVTGKPGSKFSYNDMSVQIVSLILKQSTGQAVDEYAKQQLYEPLGINISRWITGTEGDIELVCGVSRSLQAFGILLTARDFAKIGYLFLRNGTWDDRELMPAQWVKDSTTEQIKTKESSGYFRQYGYYWWVHTFGTHPGYFALGWGGQVVCIVPELDLVAVVTSKESGHQHNRGLASIEGDGPSYIDIIEKYIIAAIKK